MPTFESGDFAFDEATRTLKGILLPFGETSRPSQSGHVSTFTAEDILLPRDPSVVSLNRKHDRHDPVGRATVLEKQEAGVYAEFQLADTEEADLWLSTQRETLRKLSPEVKFLDADLKRARLTGSALVTEGAFASAGLFAIAATEDTITHTDDPEEEIASEVQAPEPTPDQVNPTIEEESEMTSSIVPDAGAQTPVTPDNSASALFAALATRDADALNNFQTEDKEGALFAIAPLLHAGPTTVTIGADTQQSGYLGELWKRQPYQRKYVPLFTSAPLTNYKVYGWQWDIEPVVAAYAGNGAEVPSNAIDTKPITADARRIAGGHRIDRRYLDFNDQAVIESYFRLMTESYARVSDLDILAAAVTAAGAATNITVKAGVDAGVTGIIQGALKVLDATGDTPTFAVVSPSVYEGVLYTIKNAGLEFLSQSFGLTGGEMAGFQIVPGNVGVDNVLVGTSQALTVFELPGAPIRVEGLAPHHGAVDPALYGYLAHLVNNSAGLALMHTTP